MPDQSQNAAPAPTSPNQNPAPAPVNQNQNQPQGKKSNVGLIVVIVILVVLILFGVGGYLAYRYAKNKVNNALNTATSTTGTTSSDSATNTANSIADTYNSAKDLTPVSSVGVEINTEVKSIISGVFGGAKLSSEMDLGDTASLTYTIKRLIAATDYTAVESAFIAKGWVKVGSYNTSSDFSLDFTKNNISLSVSGSDKGQEVTATASRVSQ